MDTGFLGRSNSFNLIFFNMEYMMIYYPAWLKHNNRIVGYTRCPKDGEKYFGEKVSFGDSINDHTALHQHGKAVLVNEETALKTDKTGYFDCKYKSFNWGFGSPIDK